MIKIINNKKYILALGFITTCVALFMSVQIADAEQKPVRMIVTFDEGEFVVPASQQALAARFDGQVETDLSFMNAVVVTLPSQASARALERMRGVADVYEDVEMSLVKKPDGVGKPGGGGDPEPVPTEEIDWGVDAIDADLAWTKTVGAGVKVAILDTGIDADHPDLQANVVDGVGFVPRQRWHNDGNGHGTHVAGTVASVDNETGYIGVAPEADIYAVQVLDRRGSGYLAYLLNGINWAIEKNVDVISMSLSFDFITGDSLIALETSLNNAEAAGIVVVAAAGNSGSDAVAYPAAHPTVMAVAATADVNDNLASYSNYGVGVDIAAPGSSITSTWKGGGYNTISGTSMATPHVAGVVALVLGQGVVDEDVEGTEGFGRINDEVFTTIVNAGIHPVVGSYGFGRIDAMAALGL